MSLSNFLVLAHDNPDSSLRTTLVRLACIDYFGDHLSLDEHREAVEDASRRISTPLQRSPACLHVKDEIG
jgi:hypothetical protein